MIIYWVLALLDCCVVFGFEVYTLSLLSEFEEGSLALLEAKSLLDSTLIPSYAFIALFLAFNSINAKLLWPLLALNCVAASTFLYLKGRAEAFEPRFLHRDLKKIRSRHITAASAAAVSFLYTLLVLVLKLL